MEQMSSNLSLLVWGPEWDLLIVPSKHSSSVDLKSDTVVLWMSKQDTATIRTATQPTGLTTDEELMLD